MFVLYFTDYEYELLNSLQKNSSEGSAFDDSKLNQITHQFVILGINLKINIDLIHCTKDIVYF